MQRIMQSSKKMEKEIWLRKYAKLHYCKKFNFGNEGRIRFMKKDLVKTALGYRCFLSIEEIEVTDPKDKKECKILEEFNDSTAIKKIALKYTDNKLFHEITNRLVELDKVDLTEEECAERQSLITLSQYFRVKF